MIPSLAALLLAAGIVLIGVPKLSPWAYRSGWFERATQTRRARSQRRPTHGGLVLAVALVAGSLAAGVSQPGARATVAAAAIAVLTGRRAERGKGTPALRWAGVLGVAVAVPLCGVRAELTGGDVVDAVLTAILVLLLLLGIRSLERSDSTVPTTAAIGAMALLLIGARIDDPAAPLAAAVVGACLAMTAHSWPPAAVRIGAIGPPVLAAALASAAIEIDPQVSATRAIWVPLLALAPFAVAVVVPEWDRRLRRRGLQPHVAIPLVAIPGAIAAERLAADAIPPVLAALLLLPVGFLGLVGLFSPRPRRRAEDTPRRTGRVLAVVGVVLIVGGGVAVISGLAAYKARGEMNDGREQAIAGLDAARSGDLDTAQARFAAADASFSTAADRLDNPVVRLGLVVPGVAQNLRSARVLADVGQDLSGTAVAVAQRAGADDLRMVDGKFPVDAAKQVGTQLDAAYRTLLHAADRLDATASPFLLPEVRDGTDAVAVKVADAADSLEVATQATRLLPDLLGGNGERRWMVAILAPSERRGAGGLAGDWAELKAAGGDINLVEDYTTAELNAATDPVKQAKVLPAIYADEYGGFKPAQLWQNLSATPDVPTLGQAVAASYPLLPFGGPVSGLITIDPYAVADLLKLTGPISVPEWPVPLSGDNAAQVLLFDQYDQLPQDQLDAFQSSVTHALVDALTKGTLPGPSELASTLAPAVAGGHLHLWSPKKTEEALFARIGADGTLAKPRRGDFVQLVTQNGGENKIDWYQRRTLTYEPTFDPSTGALAATATVTVTNTAPTEGVSSYIIGEEGGPTQPGEDRVHVTLMTPHDLVSVTDAAGHAVPVNLGREQGFTTITVLLRIPSGASATLKFEVRGQLEPTTGDYRLEVGHRAAVVPDTVNLKLQPGPGWTADPVQAQQQHTADDAWRPRVRLRQG